ncbi:MAG: glutathione S-transferase N-terminal domain-containing protein [Rhodospirillales bacterium]|nr:glutathione S-transferase N-terminal domain-containing protein [Rhodospirillales bacterium]
MTRQLYDLTAADGTRFSPYCWRVKLALAHKNLKYETIPWHFTEKEALAASGQEKVPVLQDGANIVSDSQIIADYLERTYPNEESLFGDAPARALTMFVKEWTETALHPAIARVVVVDVYRRIAPKDQAYFRTTREAMFKRSLEEIEAKRPAALEALQMALRPLRRLLGGQRFMAGDTPNWADHIVFGALQWGRLMSSTPLLAEGDAILDWMSRVLVTYGLEG